MEEKLFAQLSESMEQMGEILRGERESSRITRVEAEDVREIRRASKLSQAKFAELLGISVHTLRNYEQGRRAPQGPTQALFRAIKNDPANVIAALAG
ncbi:MAG: NadS family protein [Pseudomonadota bacterium]